MRGVAGAARCRDAQVDRYRGRLFGGGCASQFVRPHMAAAPELLALLEYRMRAIAIGHLALRYAMAWESAPSLKIYFDELQVMEGRATGFTNAAIEAAIMHSRALLEFLGLGAGKTARRQLS
jgi:hypothetical protein